MSRAERRFVWAWTLLLWIVAFVPVWHGYREAPPGWEFTGFVGKGGSDYHAYLAWIRQALDGELLFRNLYTTEPHGRSVLLPLFWLVGTLARLTGAPVIAVWYAFQALGSAVLVGGIYRFGAAFTDDVPTRRLATVLATTASGLGWIGAGSGPLHTEPIDTWMPEANVFRAVSGSFLTLPLALGLLLRVLARAIAFLDHGARRDAVIAGVLALCLAAVHPYEIVTLYALLGVWFATRPRRWTGALWIVGLSAPFVAYGALAVHLDPMLSRVSWTMSVPTLEAHLVGLGVPLLLALLGLCWPEVRRHPRHLAWLVSWPVVVAVLVALPLGFQRELIWGVTVPLCLLSAMTARTLFQRILGERGDAALRTEIGGALAVLLVALCAVGSAVSYLDIFRQNALHWPGRHLPLEYGQALRWLDEHGQPEEVVLAAPVLARRLPGRTGLAVFEGHWAQTLDRPSKHRFVVALFQAPGTLELADVARVLERNRVRFVAVDRASAARYQLAPPGSDYAFLPLVDPVYRNDQIEIFQVRDYTPASPETPWPPGTTWRSP